LSWRRKRWRTTSPFRSGRSTPWRRN